MLNSLALRLLLSSILWSVFALLVAGFLLSALYQQSVERGFDQRLNVYLKILVAAQAEAEDPLRMEVPTLTEPNFDLVLSGWYWQISTTDGNVAVASRSLFAETLPEVDFDSFEPAQDGSVAFFTTGPASYSLRILARKVITDQHEPVIVMVAGNAGNIQEDIARFRTRVFITLAVLGLVLAISTLVQVKWGLSPLRRITRGLNDIREGRSQDLQGRFPSEIQPLVNELNALIRFNKKVISRSRTHVGNLAHALKTPISILRNESRDKDTAFAKMVIEQTDSMHAQVTYHLDRAQIIARRGVLSAANPVQPTIEGLMRAMKKIHRDKNISMVLSLKDELQFAGEIRDLEEVFGNLIDNACKWAALKVEISGDYEPNFLMLRVEDDGPGLNVDQQKQAMKRGNRLDEQTPGSGLGLSIVLDLVSSYNGSFSMGRSDLGGLSATVRFPRSDHA